MRFSICSVMLLTAFVAFVCAYPELAFSIAFLVVVLGLFPAAIIHDMLCDDLDDWIEQRASSNQDEKTLR